MEANDTIIALSTGSLPSGVAIVRISGARCRDIAQAMCGGLSTPREASLKTIIDPTSQDVLDQGIVLYFNAPNSFTGEDCLEFHLHGGQAVVSLVIDALIAFNGVRHAEAGEFSRRAFENNKLDLTTIEGLSDLLAAETKAQHSLGINQSHGHFGSKCENWRKQIIHIRALIEAELDFSEEEDVPEEISVEGLKLLNELETEISLFLDDNHAGEIIRDGFKIALLGKPNAGKSTLLNKLAKRDIAIVTPQAGTTRDVLDVHLDIGGYSVILSDTAGIRQSNDIVENEGIRRAISKGDNSDLVLWLADIHDSKALVDKPDNALIIFTKNDDGSTYEDISISCETDFGIKHLLVKIEEIISQRLLISSPTVITRSRHRELISNSLECIQRCALNTQASMELRAEALRLASISLGKISGKIDVEDILDVIFSEFCVGK